MHRRCGLGLSDDGGRAECACVESVLAVCVAGAVTHKARDAALRLALRLCQCLFVCVLCAMRVAWGPFGAGRMPRRLRTDDEFQLCGR